MLKVHIFEANTVQGTSIEGLCYKISHRCLNSNSIQTNEAFLPLFRISILKNRNSMGLQAVFGQIKYVNVSDTH